MGRMIFSSVVVGSALACSVAWSAGPQDTPVLVVVDMDAALPGIQTSIAVPACAASVEDIAVYIFDPLGERTLWSIGYLGGIDRGIAFGHVPDPQGNVGTVAGLNVTAGAPVNPGNTIWFAQSPGVDPGFSGPEVQYLEHGANAPALIAADPAEPIFTVTVQLADPQPGDRFDFHVLDFVAVWVSGFQVGGAFSTQDAINTLDTGGDAVPDGTVTIYGVDADIPAPVPPAAYAVDYIDGPAGGGPAVVEIVATQGDVDGDGVVGVEDLTAVILAWGRGEGPADLNGDGTVDVLDLTEVILAWGSCGPA